jgi:hypothetical protein
MTIDAHLADGETVLHFPDDTPQNVIDQTVKRHLGVAPAGATVKDRAEAAVAGVNRAGYSGILGMPVDTMLNVADLAKAGVGYVGGKLGLMKPDQLPQLTNREQMVGSSDWFANRARDVGIAVDPPRPDDLTSRMLFAGGQGAMSALPFGPKAGMSNIARNAVLGASTQGAGAGAAEMGADPATQVLASFMPGAALPVLARAGQGSIDRMAQIKADNAVRDASIAAAQKAGYVFPPSQVNPSFLNKRAEGLSGKISTEQEAAVRNQAVSDALVRKDLGLHPAAPLTAETMGAIRAQEGKAYGAVQQMGEIPVDRQYVTDWLKIKRDYQLLATNSKQLRIPAAEDVINDSMKPGWDAHAAIELVKQWRKDGYANAASPDPEKARLGKIQLGVQNAIEDLVSRRLQQSGNTDLFNAYQQARVRIAKSYTAENAINEGTGHVDATKLARAWNAGKPMTGPMADVARSASVAPQSMREITRSPPGTSVLDWAVAVPSIAAGIFSGHPSLAAGALLPLGRPVARSAILSQPYQKRFAQTPDYQASMGARMAADLFPQDTSGLLGAYAFPASR